MLTNARTQAVLAHQWKIRIIAAMSAKIRAIRKLSEFNASVDIPVARNFSNFVES